MLTQAELQAILDYDPDTGVFTWKRPLSNRVRAGDVAGSVDNVTGYLRIRINGKGYQAHRLAWFYVYGEWPKGQIDHKDGNKRDNRISRLKDVTSRENNQNRHIHRRGRLVGASFQKKSQKWQAYIRIAGKLQHLGFYPTELEAHNAYVTEFNQVPQ